MTHDEIIREVRDNREAYAERFGFDIWALYRDAKERERTSEREVISLKPHRIGPGSGASDRRRHGASSGTP